MRVLATSLVTAALSLGLGAAALPVQASEQHPGADKEANAISQPTPLISQTTNDEATSPQNEEDAWRVYLDVYAFLPLETNSTTTINENSTSVNVPLSSILDTLTGALTFKASAEYGRLGVLTGVNHAANSASTSASYWRETENPFKDALGLPGLRQRRIRLKGNVDVDLDMNQTVIDLAMRYRAGAIQRPHMEQGSSSFVGFAGARLIDANLSTSIDFRNDTDVTVNGKKVSRSFSRRIETSASDSWGNTWVQPLIGMMATYAISNDWQAFAYLDAGGFGLAGERDLSGTAQVGIAYALGNSAQASLSYKYFGLDYAGGSGNGYTTSQSGVNLGLRWLFD